MSEPTQDDFDCIKSVALSSMETAEALMDECVKRADKIKELESDKERIYGIMDRQYETTEQLMLDYAESQDAVKELETRCDNLDKACERREISILKESDKLATKNILLGDMLLRNESEIKRLESSYRSALIAISVTERSLECRDGMVARLETVNKELKTALGHMADGEREADKEIERLQQKIFDIEGQEDLVTTELEHRACVAEEQLRVVKEMLSEVLEDWEAQRHYIYEHKVDLEMLDLMLEVVNPIIKSGNYAQPMAYYQILSRKMNELCGTVVQFRRRHNMVG